MQLETRFVSLFAADELRLSDATAEQPHRFVGLLPFNALSVEFPGGWKERLMPSAFRTTLSSGNDIRALVDHNAEKLLGRTSSGTLRVAETDKGLAVEIDVPGTSYGNDLRELVRRKDVRGLSFGFKVRQGGQRFVKEGGLTIRELHDIDLREVSVVSTPAYADTTLALRSAVIDPDVSKEISRPNWSRCATRLRNSLVEG